MGKTNKITLLDKQDTLREIKKHSGLVQMSNVPTLLHKKLINACIWITRDQLKRNPNQVRFWTELGILRRLTDYKDGKNDQLKTTLKYLRKNEFEFNILGKDKKLWRNFSFFSDVWIMSYGRGKPTYVFREFPSDIRRAIKDPGIYVSLNLRILFLLNSKHSYTLYEHLKDYVGIKKYSCSPDDFRKMMWLTDNQYKSFSMLSKRLIQVSVDELNQKTDLYVKWHVEKIGRKPISIGFSMKLKKGGVLGLPDLNEVYEKLKLFGIQDHQIDQLLKNHGNEYIMGNIAVVEKKLAEWKAIKNIPAYLMKAFEIDFRPEQTEFTQLEEQRAYEQKVNTALENQAQQEIDDLKVQFEAERKMKISKAIEALSAPEFDQLKAEFEDEISDSEYWTKIYARRWFDHEVIQKHRHKFLSSRFLASEYQDFDHYKNRTVQVEDVSN